VGDFREDAVLGSGLRLQPAGGGLGFPPIDPCALAPALPGKNPRLCLLRPITKSRG
jgi:hypothetical protein